jgi:hypothetical protein
MGNTGEHKSFADGEGGGGIAAAPEDRRPLPSLQWARFADLPPFGIGRDTAKRFRYFRRGSCSISEGKAPTYDDELKILDNHLIPNPAAIGEYKRNSGRRSFWNKA